MFVLVLEKEHFWSRCATRRPRSPKRPRVIGPSIWAFVWKRWSDSVALLHQHFDLDKNAGLGNGDDIEGCGGNLDKTGGSPCQIKPIMV